MAKATKAQFLAASIFIPKGVTEMPSGWLLGWWIAEPSPLVYVLGILHTTEPSHESLRARCVSPENRVIVPPSILGYYENRDKNQDYYPNIKILLSTKKHLSFYMHFKVAGQKLTLCEIVCRNVSLTITQNCCKIFFYEPLPFLCSKLLSLKIVKEIKWFIFVKEDFDRYNCVEKLYIILQQWKRLNFSEDPKISDVLGSIAAHPGIHTHQETKTESCEKLPYLRKFVWKILLCSAFFRQFYQRFYQLMYVVSGNETKKESQKCLRCQNIVLSVILDTLLGIFLLYKLLDWFAPIQLLDFFMVYANFVVDHLQTLLHWLMGVPAGLKLNYPLNSALGHFFLYHIYLWKTYITVVKPLLHHMLDAIRFFGWLGLSFQMSLFSDLMSLATFHVYCFYVYAARLYNLHLSGLFSLWRLVRGRKWNPLRHRVDSCAYTTDQLYLGTIIFMILLFLMPTTFLYYVVFSSLRLGSLALLGLIHYIISVVNTAPLYAVLAYLRKSNDITGEVIFTVMPEEKSENPAVIIVKNSPSSLEKIWSLTKPTDFVPKGKPSWGQLLSSLFSGKLIYPF